MVVNVEGENMRVDNLPPIDLGATSAGGSAGIVNPGQYGHPGSWWGLPENGLTEMITGWINPSAAHASEGLGSDFFPNATADANNNNDPTTPPPTTPPPTTPPGGSPYNPQPTNNNNGSGGSWSNEANKGTWNGQTFYDANEWRKASGQNPGGGQNGGGQQDESQMISNMYAPALSALDQVMQNLQSSQTKSTGMISDMYGSSLQNIGNEQNDLQSGLRLQEEKLGSGAMNANDQARRDYNALIQQGKSAYGMGSSAGGAISELVRQEYMRTGGQMRQQVQEGIQQLGLEATKLKTYISDKKIALDNWKMQAMKDINDTFKSGMNDIALRRGDIEANKTRDKITLLQAAKDRVQAIADRDYAFKQNLGQFAVETLQQATGKAFTPQEIAGVVNEMMQQTLGESQRNTTPGGQVAYRIPGVKTQDELDKLANPYQQNA